MTEKLENLIDKTLKIEIGKKRWWIKVLAIIIILCIAVSITIGAIYGVYKLDEFINPDDYRIDEPFRYAYAYLGDVTNKFIEKEF